MPTSMHYPSAFAKDGQLFRQANSTDQRIDIFLSQVYYYLFSASLLQFHSRLSTVGLGQHMNNCGASEEGTRARGNSQTCKSISSSGSLFSFIVTSRLLDVRIISLVAVRALLLVKVQASLFEFLIELLLQFAVDNYFWILLQLLYLIW